MKKNIIYFLLAVLLSACNQSSSIDATPDAAKTGATEKTSFKPADINEQVIYSRAFDAVIWGMPAVNYDLMRQTMFSTTNAKENEILYWSRPANWKNQTLTPNPDAIYLMCFYNTKNGPVVIEVPPADSGSFAANIDDVWQTPLEDAGPEGADKGEGGKYLILPPGYKQKVPQGYIVLQNDVYGGYALFRSNLKSHSDEDVAKSLAYGRRLKVYPLSHVANQPATKYTDAMNVVFDATIPHDARFFQNLNRIIQDEPWLERDKVMIDQLKIIGIEKGKPFNPDARHSEILRAASIDAQAWLESIYNKGLPPYWEGLHWGAPVYREVMLGLQSNYADPNVYPVDYRGLTYTYGFIGIKRLGTAQFYLMGAQDNNGNTLDGNKLYQLTIPANAPMKQYWSTTVYDRHTHALVRNMTKASISSQIPGLQKNPDGSIDIYFGPKAPQGKESNWVPTDTKGQFEVLFRIYGPEESFFKKIWKLNDIAEVK